MLEKRSETWKGDSRRHCGSKDSPEYAGGVTTSPRQADDGGRVWKGFSEDFLK